MAVYEVYKQQVLYRYKSTLCSKATLVLIISSLLTVLVPLIVSYRSNGFWLKTDTYEEQPEVVFTHDYLLVLETLVPHAPVLCGAQSGWSEKLQRHCIFKLFEEDINRDGKTDVLHINVQVPLHDNESVYSVTLVTPFDFRLGSICQLEMKSFGVVQYNAALAGASLDVAADLRFTQRKPLRYQAKEILFSSSGLNKNVSLREVLLEYAQRNFSTALVNRYDVWIAGRNTEDPFTLSLRLTIPANTIVYRPGFWQVIKWAWMQYLSVLVIFIFFCQIVKEYIFSNQLVPTCRYTPWKKIE